MARRRMRSTAPARAGSWGRKGCSRFGSESTHCRVASGGRTPSLRWAAAGPRRSGGRRPRPSGGCCTKGRRCAPRMRRRPGVRRHRLRIGRGRSRGPGCRSGDTRGSRPRPAEERLGGPRGRTPAGPHAAPAKTSAPSRIGWSATARVLAGDACVNSRLRGSGRSRMATAAARRVPCGRRAAVSGLPFSLEYSRISP